MSEAREALDGIITAYKIAVLSYSNTPEKEIDKALRPFIKRLDEEFDRLDALEKVVALPHNALIHKHITAQADLATAKKRIVELTLKETTVNDIVRDFSEEIDCYKKDLAAERAKVKLAIKLIFDAKKTGTYPLGNEETLMNWLTETTQDEESA